MIDLIGSTPLVRINKINPNKKVEVFAKLEKMNPGGSVKDRIAKYMIEYAEIQGRLTKDKTIIEATSGNTGIGLAMIGAVKGYRVRVVMPETMSVERRKIMRMFGAEITLTSGSKGMDGAIDVAREIAKDKKKYWMPDQFSNEYNVLAHYETTGREIWEQTQGKITHFVAGMGTGGTLMGVSRRLKEYNPRIRIIGVEPHEDTPIPGLKNMKISYMPRIFDESKLDEKIVVRVEDAVKMARLLARKEGLLVGLSSGAAMYAAIKKSKELDRGVIVVLFPDGGEKYMSTPLFER